MIRKLLLIVACMLCACMAFASVTLLDKGSSDFSLCIDNEEEGEEEGVFTALTEFQTVMKKISGVSFERKSVPECKKGKTIHFRTDGKLKNGEVFIFAKDGDLHFTGSRGYDVYDAVCYFFQKEFGVRWLWPGEDGEYIPKTDSKKFSDSYKLRHVPSIVYRGFHMCGDWYKIEDFMKWSTHNYINVNRHRLVKGGKFVKMESNHNVYLDSDLFEEHPEYFCEINGKRYTSQICMCNDVVDEIIYKRMEADLIKNPDMEIYSIFPSDNQEYCQCEKCKAKGVSTAWFDFYNRLTDKLKKKFPHVKFSTIAYQGYIKPPKNPVRNSEFVEFASYPRCNIHMYGNPDCEHCKKTLALMKEWQATGTPMGHYGYEFDAFTGNCVFTPFYSLVQDAVKTSVKLNHKLVMTEVGLSPRNGPDIKSGTFRDRLAVYLYAQFMWDANANLKELVADWCRCAYGPAAKTMTEYYLYLDKTWNDMKIHWGILGNSVSMVESFLKPEVVAQVKAYFDEADKLLNKQPCKALAFEKQLWGQWLGLIKEGVTLPIPKLRDKNALLKAGADIADTGIKIGWTEFNIRIGTLTPPFVVKLSTGMGAASYFFAMTSKGKQLTWRVSEVGVKENVDMEWMFKENIAIIPFAAFEYAPTPGETWEFKLKYGKSVWPGKDVDAALTFSGSASVGRSIFWVEGGKEGLTKKLPGVKKGFEDAGWTFQLAQTPDEFPKAKADVYFFRHAGYKGVLNPEHYSVLREKVKDGATAVFYTYFSLPIEKMFNNPTLGVKIGSIGNVPLSQRVAKTVKKGGWLNKPNESLERAVRYGLAPAYNFRLENPEQWVVLATEPLTPEKDGPEAPFLVVRPYGKGMIVLIGADPRISHSAFLDNIITNRMWLFEDFHQKD